MIRTEDDLRALYAERAESAPDASALLGRLDATLAEQSGAQRVERRRWPVALAASVAVAATIVATVVAGIWLVGSGTPRPQAVLAGGPSAADPSTVSYTYHLDRPPARFAVQSQLTYPTGDLIVYSYDAPGDGVTAGDASEMAAIVYRKGAFDPTSVQRGSRVGVDGVAGYSGSITAALAADDGREYTGSTRAVAWQYAPDSWAVVYGIRSARRTEAAELSVARTVHPGRGRTVLLPFKVGWIPDGLLATGTTFDSGPQPFGSASFTRGLPPRAPLAEYPAMPPLEIVANHSPTNNPANLFEKGVPAFTVGGRPAQVVSLTEGAKVLGRQLTMIAGGYVVMISVDRSVSRAMLIKVAEHLTVARAGNATGTWFTAAAALDG